MSNLKTITIKGVSRYINGLEKRRLKPKSNLKYNGECYEKYFQLHYEEARRRFKRWTEIRMAKSIPKKEMEEMSNWMNNNIKGYYIRWTAKLMYFSESNDAIAFKLAWL